MGKRGNDNAQITKEDYDALESRDSLEGGLKEGFARASAEEMAKRRFIRPVKTLGVPAPAARSAGAGLFANVNLTTTTTTTMPAGGASTMPSFAMPSAPAPARRNPFAGIALTATTTTAAAPFPAARTTAASQSKTEKLLEEFKNYAVKASVREDPELPIKRFLSTYFALKNSEPEVKRPTVAASNPPPATSGSSAPTATKPALSSTSTSLFTPAPAPVAFSFGGSTSSVAPSQAGDTKPIFSFGTSSSVNLGTGSSTAPASSGFNFAPAPMAAAPVPGTNVKIALTPVDTTDDTDDPQAPEEKTELASADTDWEELLVVQVKAYHHRTENKYTKFAAGGLKLQQNKMDSTMRRMVMRDGAGKVLVNIGIFKSMTFAKSIPEAQQAGKSPLGRIVFFGTMDAKRGPEKFMMVCKKDNIEELHKKLEELSS